MVLAFPANTSNGQNPRGDNTGLYLQHCVPAEKDNIRDTPIRCYGPCASCVPNTNFIEVYYQDYIKVEGGVSKPIKAYKDPTGNIEITYTQMLPHLLDYVASNTAFLTDYKTSWNNMITAGYGTVNDAGGRLGSLQTFDAATC